MDGRNGLYCADNLAGRSGCSEAPGGRVARGLDARETKYGAFTAAKLNRNERSMIAWLRVAPLHGHELRTSVSVIAQAWRSAGGKQAGVAKLLRATGV